MKASRDGGRARMELCRGWICTPDGARAGMAWFPSRPGFAHGLVVGSEAMRSSRARGISAENRIVVARWSWAETSS